MDFSIRQSLKSPRHSFSKANDEMNEKLPILLAHEEELANRSGSSSGRNEVIVKVDGDGGGRRSDGEGGEDVGGQIYRESSYVFWRDGEERVNVARDGGGFQFPDPPPGSEMEQVEDPPSKLIGQFLHRQQASGDISLDMDLEMDVLRAGKGGLPPVAESPSADVALDSAEMKVRFSQSKVVEEGKGRSADMDGSEVVRCTSNGAHQRKSSHLRTKTKSRLMDPIGPEQNDKKSGRLPGKSGQQRSGFLSGRTDEEEDDPFSDEDLPDEYKKFKLGMVTMAEWISLILIIAALVCSLTIQVLRTKTIWDLNLWKWEVMLFVLICGRLVSGWVMRVVVFLIERNFLLRKRVLYFVYGLRKAVQNCLWLGLVLLTWHFLFDKKVRREMQSKPLQYVTKVLVCFLIGTLIWLVKTLMVKVLASSFHLSTYFDRIQESLFNQYVIETLSGPPLIEMKQAEDEESRLADDMQRFQNAGANIPPELKAGTFMSNKSHQIGKSGGMDQTPKDKSHKLSGATPRKQDEGISIDHLHRLNTKNVSAWKMKRLINIVRYGSLTTLDEQLLDATNEDEKQMQIRSEVEAKAAAKKIFHNVAKPRSKFIYLEDLMRFMQKDEAEKTLNLFEGASEAAKISKSCLKNWVVNAFRERRALALTLNDTKTAVNRLHQMVNVIVGIIIGIIWLIILGIATSKLIFLVSSQLVLAAFIFGNTLKTIFEAIIFLFVIHPFDVGDRCEIDGNQLVVEEMNILSTVFLRYDNQKVVYLNSLLALRAIHNFYRSPDMGDAVDFCVHIATPAEKIALIKQRITSYIEMKTEHWYPQPMIVLRDLDGLQGLQFSVWLTHRINHQDMGEKWTRRAELVEEMVRIFKEVDLQYRLYPMEINVRTMPGPNSTRQPPDWAPALN
uniref:Mechanosensitive ion channel protein n=1 Tax=Kalanchoe fedtschenkoi TaxID=63787 RepID=A0A7N0ZYQ3_KALFE